MCNHEVVFKMTIARRPPNVQDRQSGKADRPQQLAIPAPAPSTPLDGFRVRESARAKRMSIHVSPHVGVEVVVPRATSAARVARFVEEHRGWIERTRRSLADTPCPAFDLALPERIELAAIDGAWDVVLEAAPTRGVQVHEQPGQLRVRGPVHDEDACRRGLQSWLAGKGRTYLVPWLTRLASHYGFTWRRVQIRGQKTRWGSCSSRGTISLNYSLLFLSPPLVRYLMLHELTHTRVMAHDERFWSLLTAMEPRARSLDGQMNDAWREIPGWAMARRSLS
jgi:predicted metal-dependent hydrolase